MGWEVSFSLLCGGVGRRGHLLRGGWSHSPPVGKGGDVDDSVLCAGGGYGGRMSRCVYSLVNIFFRNVARDNG